MTWIIKKHDIPFLRIRNRIKSLISQFITHDIAWHYTFLHKFIWILPSKKSLIFMAISNRQKERMDKNNVSEYYSNQRSDLYNG